MTFEEAKSRADSLKSRFGEVFEVWFNEDQGILFVCQKGDRPRLTNGSDCVRLWGTDDD